jgi:hypothetical protein
VHDASLLAALVDPSKGVYDVKDLALPMLSGWKLRLVLVLLRAPLIGILQPITLPGMRPLSACTLNTLCTAGAGSLVLSVVIKQQGIGKVKQLAAAVGSSPLFVPHHRLTDEQLRAHEAAAQAFGLPFLAALPRAKMQTRHELVEVGQWRRMRAADYTDAYRSGRTSPELVVRQLLRDIRESNEPGQRRVRVLPVGMRTQLRPMPHCPVGLRSRSGAAGRAPAP